MALEIRNLTDRDTTSISKLLDVAYAKLENWSWMSKVEKLASSPYFKKEAFFVAEEDGECVGCVGVLTLPSKRHLAIRYLAVKEAFTNKSVVDLLIESAFNYSILKRPARVKAQTLTIQPYVGAYQEFGFGPARRRLQFAWDTNRVNSSEHPSPGITVDDVPKERADEAARVYLEGLKPYWDWWVEEEGGDEAVIKSVIEEIRTEGNAWLQAKIGSQTVGVTGLEPHNPNASEAWSEGVAVLPQFRIKGAGSALMSSALRKAKELGFARVVLSTVSYLDCLTPAAVLYLKSGGRMEAEYLELTKQF